METYEIHDGSRCLTFVGEKIGDVSSHRSTAPRWSEYRLFRTAAGQYVLQKIGRSIVVHNQGCDEIRDDLQLFQMRHPGHDPIDGWWLCDICCADGYDITSVLVESDRNWVLVTENPDDVVEALYRRKGGAKSLPRLSIDLLERAAAVDERIAVAYRVEHLA